MRVIVVRRRSSAPLRCSERPRRSRRSAPTHRQRHTCIPIETWSSQEFPARFGRLRVQNDKAQRVTFQTTIDIPKPSHSSPPLSNTTGLLIRRPSPRSAAAASLRPQRQHRFAFSFSHNSVVFRFRFGRWTVPTYSNKGSVALQHTPRRPKPDSVSTTLKRQRNSNSQTVVGRWSQPTASTASGSRTSKR